MLKSLGTHLLKHRVFHFDKYHLHKLLSSFYHMGFWKLRGSTGDCVKHLAWHKYVSVVVADMLTLSKHQLGVFMPHLLDISHSFHGLVYSLYIQSGNMVCLHSTLPSLLHVFFSSIPEDLLWFVHLSQCTIYLVFNHLTFSSQRLRHKAYFL